ncbi:MAG: amidohydrolase family protein [Gemmatimonadetes bacterium]|nr:amidohydrolase family protein [Gemmatimonadota bacterium]
MTGKLLALVALPAALAAQAPTNLPPAERAFVAVDAPIVALTGVTVIDGTGAAPRPDQTIVVQGGKISWVGPSASARIPEGARVLALAGHTVIPGLVGLHNHTFYGGASWPYVHQPVSAPRLYLAAGVTTIRTTGSIAPYQDMILKRAIDGGETVGPRMYVTGPYINGPGGNHGIMHEIVTPEAARREAAYWAEEGASWLKAYDRITRPALKALVDEAHKRGVKVTGHLCSIGYREAVAAGMDAVEHGLFANQEYDPDKRPDQCPGVKMSVFENLDLESAAVKATFKDLVDHRVAMTSTVVIIEGLMANRPPIEQRTMDVLYPPAREAYLQARAHMASPEGKGSAVTEAAFKKMLAYELAFVRAGGLLGAGVDPSGIGGVPAGLGDQRNYELFLEGGFTPVEAIQVLSANGARILGEADRFGTIAAGKAADLVVINGDPVARPAEIRNVTLVFKEGVGYDSAKLIASVKGMVGLR